MSDYFELKRTELLKKIARERLAKPEGWQTRLGPQGETILVPTLAERMVLTGAHGLDASDDMAQIQQYMRQFQSTQGAEDYIAANIDAYPALADYDVADGKAGAIQIVRDEDAFKKGKEYLETTGYSLSDLGLDPGGRYTTATLGPLVRKRDEVKAAKLREPAEKLAQGQLSLAEKVEKNRNAQVLAQAALQKQIADNAQFNTEEQARFRAHQLKVEGIRAENASRERKYENAQNRALTRDQNALTIQLAEMNRADRREDRRYDREERAEERRKAKIIRLIESLMRLGSAFSL